MKHAQRFSGNVVRANKPHWTREPTSGEGAAKFGGRFNPIGVPALYTSLSFVTAGKEVRFSVNLEPYTFYFLEVDCADILDLTSSEVRKAIGVSLDELECSNWESEMRRGLKPASHLVHERLVKEGYAGILVNSFAAGATRDDINLILWTWDEVADGSTPSDHAVRVINADSLSV